MAAEDVFTRFIAAIEARDLEGALSFLAEDVEYHNMPMDPAHGRQEARNLLAPLIEPALEVRWEVHRSAARGPVVFTERTDRFHMPAGWIEIPVVGVAEVHDDQITLWRDYFDMQGVAQQFQEMAGEPA